MCDTPINVPLLIISLLDYALFIILGISLSSYFAESGELNPEGMAYRRKKEAKRGVLHSSLILIVINLVYWMIWKA